MEPAEKQTVAPTIAKKGIPFFSKGEGEPFFSGASMDTSFFKGGSGPAGGSGPGGGPGGGAGATGGFSGVSESTIAPVVQTKLSIGQPNDPFEIEADKAADAFVQRKVGAPAGPPDNPSQNTSTSTPFVIRRCAECDAKKEKKI